MMRRFTSGPKPSARVAAYMSCKPAPVVTKRKLGTQTISASYDPSVSGLPGPVGEVVEVAGGATAWVKYGTGVTQWQAFPGSGSGGASGGGIEDGGVTAPLSGAGSVADPLVIAAATTSVPGSMSAADKVLLNDVTVGNWFALRKAEMVTAIPQLTEFGYQKTGPIYTGGALSPSTADGIDGHVEGGGVTFTGGSVMSFGASLFQLPKTGKWAVVFRVKLAAAASGKTAGIGLINAGSTHDIEFMTAFAVDTTHYALEVFTGSAVDVAGTVVVDGAFHNMMLTGDATNVKAYVDNVLAASSTASALTDEPMQAFLLNTTIGHAVVTQYAWGYVKP